MTYKNEALDSLDMEYVLADEGVDYKMAWGRSGRQINVRTCPFCGNDKYKTYINAATGLGNCFAGSCHQGTFNKWQFLAATWGLNAHDTGAKIKYMAMAQGWRPKVEFERYDPGELNLPNSVSIDSLPSPPRYLLNRGITTDIASYFGLRLCEKGTFEVKDPNGKTIKQDYSNRIIIPIWDRKGELVSFQGRDTTGEAEKRYLFPPMYSSTGSQLYNICNWQSDMDTVIITEGPFDCIGVHRALAKNHKNNILATASFGMSFSESKQQEDQINRLLELKNEGLKSVYFMWDNEPAAIKAALEACKKVIRYGFVAHLAILKGAKDPGEATPEQIMEAIKNAHPVSSQLQAMLLERKLAV